VPAAGFIIIEATRRTASITKPAMAVAIEKLNVQL
jgi:hypothetical protein